MNTQIGSPTAIAEELGQRLKQARLNANFTRMEVADLAGVSNTAVVGAENGKVQLTTFVAIMAALNLTEHLDRFLPEQEISPIQLSKMLGKKRRRASGQRKMREEEPPEW